MAAQQAASSTSRKTMKAARLHAPRDLRLEDVEYPTPGEGEVILKIKRASVCNGSDAALYSGRRQREIAYPWMELPWIMGHECAGEVVEVGAKVTTFKVGDRVASMKYGNAFAEFQAAPVDCLYPVPDGMPYNLATFIEVLFATFSYIHNENVRPGDSVVVCGAGPSGNLLLQEALAVGAAKPKIAGIMLSISGHGHSRWPRGQEI